MVHLDRTPSPLKKIKMLFAVGKLQKLSQQHKYIKKEKAPKSPT